MALPTMAQSREWVKLTLKAKGIVLSYGANDEINRLAKDYRNACRRKRTREGATITMEAKHD